MLDGPFHLELDPATAIATLDAIASDGASHPSARIGLDHFGKLEAPIIARLLAARKRSKAQGGTFVLVATRRDLLATLHVTGLDNVFQIEAG
jgi:anti-anti-sigma regulatory factor